MSSSNLLSGSTPLAARRGWAVLKNRLIMFFHRKCKKGNFVCARYKMFWHRTKRSGTECSCLFLPATYYLSARCVCYVTLLLTPGGLNLCQIVKNNNKRETFCRAKQFAIWQNFSIYL